MLPNLDLIDQERDGNAMSQDSEVHLESYCEIELQIYPNRNRLLEIFQKRFGFKPVSDPGSGPRSTIPGPSGTGSKSQNEMQGGNKDVNDEYNVQDLEHDDATVDDNCINAGNTITKSRSGFESDSGLQLDSKLKKATVQVQLGTDAGIYSDSSKKLKSLRSSQSDPPIEFPIHLTGRMLFGIPHFIEYLSKNYPTVYSFLIFVCIFMNTFMHYMWQRNDVYWSEQRATLQLIKIGSSLDELQAGNLSISNSETGSKSHGQLSAIWMETHLFESNSENSGSKPTTRRPFFCQTLPYYPSTFSIFSTTSMIFLLIIIGNMIYRPLLFQYCSTRFFEIYGIIFPLACIRYIYATIKQQDVCARWSTDSSERSQYIISQLCLGVFLAFIIGFSDSVQGQLKNKIMIMLLLGIYFLYVYIDMVWIRSRQWADSEENEEVFEGIYDLNMNAVTEKDNPLNFVVYK